MSRFLQIHPEDNVVVCLEPMSKGEIISLSSGKDITLLEDVNAGHKVAIRDISENENVIKYGYGIGHATSDIKAGMAWWRSLQVASHARFWC